MDNSHAIEIYCWLVMEKEEMDMMADLEIYFGDKSSRLADGLNAKSDE